MKQKTHSVIKNNIYEFKIPQRQPCIDTIETLKGLLAEAKKGSLIGIAYAALYVDQKAGGSEFRVDTTGETQRSPTLALGMVYHLQKYIEDRTE